MSNVRLQREMRRFIVWLVVAAASSIGALILLAIVSLEFPGSTEVRWESPASGVQIALQLKPLHPFLAEYEKTVALRTRNGDEVAHPLFPDTGGYLRTQVYGGPSDVFYLKGYFDVARVSVRDMRIETDGEQVPEGASYLGAFDEDASGQVRFLSPIESPEQPLLPREGQ